MSDASKGAERAKMTSFSATDAQNNFGRVLQRVDRGEAVYITRYGEPEAVVVSAERYRELSGEAAPDLGKLTREFDAMVARMQTEEAEAGFDALFAMDAAALGKAALESARTDED